MNASNEIPDAATLRGLAARLRSPDLIVFPVRHHSPACALHLLRLFKQLKPAVVLVEGPRSFTPLIPLLADESARAPLAIYTYTVQERSGDDRPLRRAAFYPFCDYSPELAAVREARRLAIPVRFIDLDFSEQCRLEAGTYDSESISLLDERHYSRSRDLQALAERLGCRDHEELWEHLFETPAPLLSLEDHIAQVAAYCLIARHDSPPQTLEADGTLQREAEMAWQIRQALEQRQTDEGPVLAIMGGFHAVAMPGLLEKPENRPKIAAAGVSDKSSALIRYSFDRLDRLNGYAAGMTSPAWHQRLWEQMLKQEKIGQTSVARLRREVALAMSFDIADALRQHHHLPLPLPAMTAAFEQMLRLAELRGRPAPLRVDLLDAVTSSFIKGDADSEGAVIRFAAKQVLGGQAYGVVPAGADRLPLVVDFEHSARRLRLKIDSHEPRRLALDIYRRPEHRQTSRLLHGLAYLNVTFAVRKAGPDFVNATGLDRIREKWEYQYSPTTEGALIEASVYGVTVPLAVAARFIVQLERMQDEGKSRDARASASLLVQACVLGLQDHLARVLNGLRLAVNEDADFTAVVEAVIQTALLRESREPLEARELEELPPVIQAAYQRAIYLGSGLQGAEGDGRQVVNGLIRLRELLCSAAGRALDKSLYWRMIERLMHSHDFALIRGAAAGLLYYAGLLTEDTLAAMLQGHLTGLSDTRESVAFLRGFLQTAREAAWRQPVLLRVLDGLLASWDEAEFVALLPELRLAFAEMTPKETDRIAEAVGCLHGLENLGRLVRHDLGAERLQANLAVSQRVREILASDGLVQWTSP